MAAVGNSFTKQDLVQLIVSDQLEHMERASFDHYIVPVIEGAAGESCLWSSHGDRVKLEIYEKCWEVLQPFIRQLLMHGFSKILEEAVNLRSEKELRIQLGQIRAARPKRPPQFPDMIRQLFNDHLYPFKTIDGPCTPEAVHEAVCKPLQNYERELFEQIKFSELLHPKKK